MPVLLQLQDTSTVADVLSSLYLAFYIYNYTMVVRNFRSFYLIQLMYIISFSFRSKNQFANKLHVSHLYIGSSTLENCGNNRNCSYLQQFIVMGVALILQILMGCYARIYRKEIKDTDGKKYVIRRIYFGVYSIVKATSIPVFFIFLDSCIDLKDIIITVVSGLMLFSGLCLNLLIFKALTFLSARANSKSKLWLDLQEYIVLYLSVLCSYLGFRYEIKHLNAAIVGLLLIFCFLSWKIKDRMIRIEEEYIESNNIEQLNLLSINKYKKRENMLQLLFSIVQVISFGILVYYFDLKEDMISSYSIDCIAFLVFSGLQFILIIILLILRLCLGNIQGLNSYLDDDGLPPMPCRNDSSPRGHVRELSAHHITDYGRAA